MGGGGKTSVNKGLQGFTLAETLVTLTLIGIVATISLPGLFSAYEEHVTIAKVHKFYSEINEALSRAIVDHGTVDTWSYISEGEDTITSTHEKPSDAFAEYFKEYLNLQRDCGEKSGCIADTYYKLNNQIYTTQYNNSARYYKMILQDGLTMWMRDYYNPGITISECGATDSGVENVCGVIWLDVNGKKAPNTIGKDVFAFFVLKDEILAHPLDDCNLNSAGWGCSSYIIRNGNMKYLHKK